MVLNRWNYNEGQLKIWTKLLVNMVPFHIQYSIGLSEQLALP